jgi:6-pyruvoyl-tetrahydropterin synthase
MDYGDLKNVIQPIIDRLDHKHLGTWMIDGNIIIDYNYNKLWRVDELPYEFYPTSENLIVWIAEQITEYVISKAGNNKLPWSRLELDETDTVCCALTREEYDK